MKRLVRVSAFILVPLFFAVWTLLITFPIVVRLDTSLMQNPTWSMDAFHHTYVLWWYKKALLDLHISPADLRWIEFPTGGQYPLLLTYSMTYLVGLPLLLFLSPVATYNLLVLLTFVLSGLTAYTLCIHLTRNRWAGLAGGIVYAFFPNRVAHAFSGHMELVSTYWFPLYLLLLIKTIERPRVVTSLLCGLTLAASMLIQPIYVIFLLAPVTLAYLLSKRRALGGQAGRAGLGALAGAFGLAGVLAAPFFAPLLLEQIRGQGQYLYTLGHVNYSADLLGLVAPSPLNPILLALKAVPAYAGNVAPVQDRISEVLVYAGLIPLALSVVAVLAYRRQVAAWGWVAVGAAVLSLGPLLKVNGQPVTLSTDRITAAVPLPYALIMDLPGIAANRAPARLDATLMLMLAVLSAYGMAWVTAHLPRGWKHIAAGAMCLITLAEFWVMWPCPTTPTDTPDEIAALARSAERQAVLTLPVSHWDAKEIALFYQTAHEHPTFDGWVQRPLNTSRSAEFLEGLFQSSPGAARDIIPLPSPEARAAVARAQGMGYAMLLSQRFPHLVATRQMFSDAFGPASFEDDHLILYAVPPGPTAISELVYALPVENWWEVEEWKGQPSRWMRESAELYLYSPGEQEGILSFTALPISATQRLQISVNDTSFPPVVVGDWNKYTTPSLKLRAGLNIVTFRALGGCMDFARDPRCSGAARVAGAECNTSYRGRCLSILFQAIRFEPGGRGWRDSLNIDLGERVRLVGYDLEGVAQPGESLKVNLYWRSLRTLRRDFDIVVQLLDPDKRLLAQHVGQPLQGLYPTSSWVPGDIFFYQTDIEIPLNAAAGEYDLLAGMAYPDLQRLPVASDRPYAREGWVWLQSIKVRTP